LTVRLAEDSGKLSVRIRPMLDLMREADAIARTKASRLVSAEHVQARSTHSSVDPVGYGQHIPEDVQHGVTLIS
jgi:predicted ATP-dependent protease